MSNDVCVLADDPDTPCIVVPSTAVPLSLKDAHFSCRWATAVNKTAAGRRSIVGRIVAALPSAAIFLAFLVLVTSVFSVLGMQFFAGKFHWPDGTISRANFDNFYQV